MLVVSVATTVAPSLRAANSALNRVYGLSSGVGNGTASLNNYLYKRRHESLLCLLSVDRWLPANIADDARDLRRLLLKELAGAQQQSVGVLDSLERLWAIRDSEVLPNGASCECLRGLTKCFAFHDKPSSELGVDLAFCQLTHPMFPSVQSIKRFEYIAKTKKMYLDVIPFDSCRYIFDLIPLPPQIKDAFEDCERQYLFRFALDGLVKQRLDYSTDYFYSGSVIADSVPGFEKKCFQTGIWWGDNSMTAYNLDVSEIANIFRDSLNVQPLSKTVAGIFANDRFRKKVDYAPFFQRNYVWDRSKATYFIESVILGTEIPPIVLFKDGTSYEVIDGRQRYETLLKFVEGSLSLDSGGLKRLRHLAGLHYADLPQQVKDSFDETKLRLLIFSVVNEPKMTSRQKDKVKREIFNRYNSGVTSLKREEVERAEYDSDLVTNYFYQRFEADEDFLACCEALFNASTKKKAPLRDRINSLLSRVRALLTMRFIPIHSYAYGKGKNDIVATFYSTNVSQCAPDELFENFRSRVNKLTMLRQLLSGSMILKNNRLVNERLISDLSRTH